MKNVGYFGGSIFKIKMNESNIWAMVIILEIQGKC